MQVSKASDPSYTFPDYVDYSDWLKSGEHTLILGTTKKGKTSLLYRIALQLALKNNTCVILIDKVKLDGLCLANYVRDHFVVSPVLDEDQNLLEYKKICWPKAQVSFWIPEGATLKFEDPELNSHVSTFKSVKLLVSSMMQRNGIHVIELDFFRALVSENESIEAQFYCDLFKYLRRWRASHRKNPEHIALLFDQLNDYVIYQALANKILSAVKDFRGLDITLFATSHRLREIPPRIRENMPFKLVKQIDYADILNTDDHSLLKPARRIQGLRVYEFVMIHHDRYSSEIYEDVDRSKPPHKADMSEKNQPAIFNVEDLKKKYNPATILEVGILLEKGYNRNQIAKKLKIPYNTVVNWTNRLGERDVKKISNRKKPSKATTIELNREKSKTKVGRESDTKNGIEEEDSEKKPEEALSTADIEKSLRVDVDKLHKEGLDGPTIMLRLMSKYDRLNLREVEAIIRDSETDV